MNFCVKNQPLGFELWLTFEQKMSFCCSVDLKKKGHGLWKKHWRSDQVEKCNFQRLFNISVNFWNFWKCKTKTVECQGKLNIRTSLFQYQIRQIKTIFRSFEAKNSTRLLAVVRSEWVYLSLTHCMEKYRSEVVYSIYDTISKIQLWILQNCKKTQRWDNL